MVVLNSTHRMAWGTLKKKKKCLDTTPRDFDLIGLGWGSGINAFLKTSKVICQGKEPFLQTYVIS